MEIKKFHNIRQPLTPEQQDQKLQDVAKLYEKQFLREMVKQMRTTVNEEGGFMPTSNAEKIFREQLDQQYVENWGDKGGIGLAKVIHEQLLDRLGPALGIRPRPQRPMGPIKIDERAQIQNPLKVQNFTPGKAQMQIDLRAVALENSEVTSPWSGTLLGAKQINPDEYLMEILHDDGLKSQMVFRGQPAPELKPALMNGEPAQMSAGQRIGLLSPEAKSLFWTVSL